METRNKLVYDYMVLSPHDYYDLQLFDLFVGFLEP